MKILFIFAAVSGALSVMFGAFAAHGLRDTMTPNMLSAFETGVQYQMLHSVAMVVLIALYRSWPNDWLKGAATTMALGIVLFSGSLYLLALTGIKWFGPITPLGGLCLIASWICVLIAAVKYDA